MNDFFASLNKWSKASKLTLDFDKTNFVIPTEIVLGLWYKDKTIEVETTEFCGVQIDYNNLNWKNIYLTHYP